MAKVQATGFTLHQVITLASIIEKETPNTTEQKQVAQVFLLRLQRGMPLGSDPTYVYGAHLLGVTPSVSVDSPYNTRKYTGLPPGAIDNFNLAALQAVLDPAPGDYVYFVADPNGVTHFARTLEEHQANVARYCASLCLQE